MIVTWEAKLSAVLLVLGCAHLGLGRSSPYGELTSAHNFVLKLTLERSMKLRSSRATKLQSESCEAWDDTTANVSMRNMYSLCLHIYIYIDTI